MRYICTSVDMGASKGMMQSHWEENPSKHLRFIWTVHNLANRLFLIAE